LSRACELLAAQARRGREFAVIGIVGCAVGAAAMAAGAVQLGWSLLIAAAVAGAGVAWVRSDRRELLTRLVAQGDALSLPAVHDFATTLGARRHAVAAGLGQAIQASSPSGSEFDLVRPERVSHQADRLRRLAEAIADPRVAVRPASLALCIRLLRYPTISPLYNPTHPEELLDRALRAIEEGVARPQPGRPLG
jgi:hypothetical protein